MKKFLTCLLSACLLCTGFAGCGPREGDQGESKLVKDRESIAYGFEKLYTKSELKDKEFTEASDIKGARFLVNGEYVDTYTAFSSRQDLKMEFYNGVNAKMVDVAGGMAYTVPAKDALKMNYSIAKYRTQITLGDSILTVSAESSNPYSAISTTWETYRDEWLLRWIDSEDYLTKNKLEYTVPKVYEDTTMREGYDIYMYSVKITDENAKIERPYYNVGIIREADDPIRFGMFVMKSKQDESALMESIVRSYTSLTPKGVSKNYYDAGEPAANPKWNEATKAYYNQLQSETKVNWGAFSYSMPGKEGSLLPGSVDYDTKLSDSKKMQEGIEAEWGHDFDIFPTYTHISWYNEMHHFPNAMAEELAGGDGKNGKPVLQFTYQFTTDNNTVSTNQTPLFDILRGVYDEHFTRLARDIKAYAKPVLFRLNNEMNSDWTSYCGMITLLDPDIFQMTWRYLYDIFEKEGVDNSIWIWNPMHTSCPYSSWGEDLSYNPGAEYVQLLGLTCYEMNNGTDAQFQSFESMYSKLYEKNKAAWGKYRAIISEFACGSGGDYTGVLGRNRKRQADWVKGMFESLNASPAEDYAKQIVGAIWFNCNDAIGDKITNRLRIYEPNAKGGNAYADLAETLAAFKAGFSK